MIDICGTGLEMMHWSCDKENGNIVSVAQGFPQDDHERKISGKFQSAFHPACTPCFLQAETHRKDL